MNWIDLCFDQWWIGYQKICRESGNDVIDIRYAADAAFAEGIKAALNRLQQAYCEEKGK